jgi:hypothetical protein
MGVDVRPSEPMGIAMKKSPGTKSSVHSLNKNAAAGPSMKGGVTPKAHGEPTAGGKGDKDGKGDIKAKKANTSNGGRTKSK